LIFDVTYYDVIAADAAFAFARLCRAITLFIATYAAATPPLLLMGMVYRLLHTEVDGHGRHMLLRSLMILMPLLMPA